MIDTAIINLFMEEVRRKCAITGFCKISGILFKVNRDNIVIMVYESNNIDIMDIVKYRLTNNKYRQLDSILANIIQQFLED